CGAPRAASVCVVAAVCVLTVVSAGVVACVVAVACPAEVWPVVVGWVVEPVVPPLTARAGRGTDGTSATGERWLLGADDPQAAIVAARTPAAASAASRPARGREEVRVVMS